MNKANRRTTGVSGVLLGLAAVTVHTQDWPQWRGANQDARVTGFTVPATWPAQPTQQWRVEVGEGVATPALVGNRLYVFSRQAGQELTRCLEADTGREAWKDAYESAGATGAAAGFSGPRSSPAVSDGKVVTLGVRGVLSCLDAATGTVVWRKDEFPGAWPRFHPSSSPIVVEGLCVAQLGGTANGGIAAYDLVTGTARWKWLEEGPAYASPVLLTVGGAKYVVAQTDERVVALSLADGKLAWEVPFRVQGMGGYNAATPLVDGQTVYYAGSGRGVTAVRLEREGAGLAGRQLWQNLDNSVQFNTPVLKDGLLYGLSAGGQLFCLDAREGTALWTAPMAASTPPPAAAPGGPAAGPRGPAARGGRGGGGGRGTAGYGSIVDAGPVLFALTPATELVVFEPGNREYQELARMRVAETPTYAYPVIAGKRIYIKDADAVTLWTLE